MEWAARESRSRELMEREENSDMPTVNLIPFTIHYSNITSFYSISYTPWPWVQEQGAYIGVPSVLAFFLP